MYGSLSIFAINVSGNKSTVLSSEGFEKAILEISHQVHDVVSKTRGTEGYHGRIRTSKFGHGGGLTVFTDLSILHMTSFTVGDVRALTCHDW